MRLLVIEDDEVIAEGLRQALTKDGYSVDVAHDGEQGLAHASVHQYGLILLDLMLPRRDGLSVCEALRMKKSNVPILMLTARDQLEDKVRGLDAGADDYLPKPFAYPELAARIRALLRRDSAQRTNLLHIADLDIDVVHKTVTRQGENIHLTPREYTLLEALGRNRGRTLTREMIVETIWADDESLSNTVNFHVTSLRKKIDVGRAESLIETVHGFGYRLREGAE
jgi:DNA-binding response OmpR family regulator